MADQKEPKQKGQPKEKEGAAKAGKKGPPAEKKPVEKRDENFRYIVRIVNTDRDGN